MNNRQRFEHLIVICTHHKTGTVWLRKVFFSIARIQELKLFLGEQSNLPTKADIFFQEHSNISLNKLNKEYRGLHIIRDPRDIIISGCFYHAKSSEKWLHEPKEYLENMTYQQKINSYSTLEEKLSFEMDYCAKSTIKELSKWDYHQTNIYEVKYENLILDHDLFLFHNIFSFLGFTGYSLLSCLDTAYKNSLFSKSFSSSKHIRSGKPKQWKNFFDLQLKRKFKNNFGNILIDLGYERDNDW